MLDCESDSVLRLKYKRLRYHLKCVKGVVEEEKIVAIILFDFLSIFFVSEKCFLYEVF